MWPAIQAGASTKEEVHRSVSNAENTASEVRDVIIVGSGPAGYTAAVYTARANLKPLLLAGSVTAGGELMNTTDVENYPGFPDGIMGPDLMENFEKQAARFGTEIQFEDVTDLDLDGDIKTVTIGSGETFQARSIILSTGSAYRELGLPNEKRLSGPRRQLVCNLRRFLLQGSGHCRDRRRGLRHGGGTVPHQVREVRHRGPPPRHPPRLQDHGRPRPGPREDQLRLEHRRRGCPRTGQSHRTAVEEPGGRHRDPNSPSPASSWQSATIPAPNSSRASWT